MEYKSKLVGNYYLNAQWNIDGNKYSSLTVPYKFTTPGCKVIEAWGLSLTKKTTYNCKTVYAIVPTANANVTKTLTPESIQKFELDDTSLEINFIF